MPKNNTVSSYKDYREDKSLQTEADLVLGTKEFTLSTPGLILPVEQASAGVYNVGVKLQSLRDARLLYDGRVSGKHYEWQRAGSIQEVDALDAPDLLSKRIKTHSCCSGSDLAVFQQVD